MRTGIIIVDHGSRRDESNKMLEQVAALFHARFIERYGIVEPAHMELAEPSIATAYGRCVERGAQRVVVCPFFLGPGKHWTQDIPRLTAEAAANHPGSRYHIAPTLGIDDLILDLLEKRASHCSAHEYNCEICQGTARCDEPALAAPVVEGTRVRVAVKNSTSQTGGRSIEPVVADAMEQQLRRAARAAMEG